MAADARMTAPRNRLTREQRVARWNAAAEAARTVKPQPVSGKGARHEWLRAVLNPQRTELRAAVRLVGAALVNNGNADGTRIYPSTRLLAGQCNLSERAICTALDWLVRRGYLQRHYRIGNAAGCGFRYVLTVPSVLNQVQQQGGVVKLQGAEPRSTAADVLNQVQRRAERNA
jgi:hypothetical protein